MSFLKKVRSNSKKMSFILLGSIFVSFLFSSGIVSFSLIFSKFFSKKIAKVCDKSIDFDFYNQYYNFFKKNYNTKYSEKEIKQISLKKLFVDKIIDYQIKKLNLNISSEESTEIVQGNRISDSIKKLFIDEKTYLFDKKLLLNFLIKLPSLSQKEQVFWKNLEDSVIKSRINEKLNFIYKNSFYITKNQSSFVEKLNENSFEYNYIFIPYEEINVEEIFISEDEYLDFLSQNKQIYNDKIFEIKVVNIFREPNLNEIENFSKDIDNIVDKVLNLKSIEDFEDFEKKENEKINLISLENDNLPEQLKNLQIKKYDIIRPSINKNIGWNQEVHLYFCLDIEENSKNKYTYKFIRIDKIFKLEDSKFDEIKNDFNQILKNKNNLKNFDKIIKNKNYKIETFSVSEENLDEKIYNFSVREILENIKYMKKNRIFDYDFIKNKGFQIFIFYDKKNNFTAEEQEVFIKKKLKVKKLIENTNFNFDQEKIKLNNKNYLIKFDTFVSNHKNYDKNLIDSLVSKNKKEVNIVLGKDGVFLYKVLRKNKNFSLKEIYEDSFFNFEESLLFALFDLAKISHESV
jgi:hypothetical protein